MLNLTDELSMAQKWHLNQFGSAVLVWCGKSIRFDRVRQTFVELSLAECHLNQMLRQCLSKVELIQLGSAHEKYGV